MRRVLPLLLALALFAPAAARAGDVTMAARDVPLGTRTLQAAAAPIRFNLIGLHWQGSGGVDYRTRSLGGHWGVWRGADADSGPDLGSAERREAGWHDGNLDWAGASDRVQFRRNGDISRLRAYYLWSKPRKVAPRRLAVAGSPAIVSRLSWAADEKIKRASPHYAPRLKLAIVHHTAGTNTYTPAQAAAIVRGIEVYHVKGNGWNDIGYNFLVDKYGTVYEGRAGGIERNVIGAHSLGFNTGTVGVALIGNYSSATPTQPEQDALVRLLAWRLDVAHVDPLSRVVDTSAGNSKFKAGKVVTLRAISGHRDTGPSECPGNRTYDLLPALAQRVAATGLPKLYSVAASGALGGPIRFQGRLSSALPWTVTVTDAAGSVVATGRGSTATVDWTWNSTRAGKGPYRWRIDAGPNVLPAQGPLGATLPVAPVIPPAPTTPTTTTTPASPPVGPAFVSALTVTPSTLAPAPDGSGLTAVVSFTLAAAAQVTVNVTGGGSPILGLLSARLPAGPSTYEWQIGVLANGRYKVEVAAQRSDGTTVVNRADVTVDRTLGSFSASPAVFSPNGDGSSDTIALSFGLTQPASVQVAIQRAGVTVATLWSAQASPGQQTIGWDGTANGVRLPDGDYVAVVTASGTLGTVSLLQAIAIDTTPPVLTLLDGASLRFDVSEPATVSATVNGQAFSVGEPRGNFSLPFGSGPATSLTAQARDAAGNASAVVSWP